MEQLGEMAREAAYTYGGDIMNVAVYEHDRIIKNVIVLDFIPQDMENEFYIECPAWCWIGDSIDRPKPDDWVDTTEEEPAGPTIEQRISDLEDAVQAIMFSE